MFKQLVTNIYFLSICLFLLVCADVLLGDINLFDSHTDVYIVLSELRLPKVITAFAIGSALALSGLVLQIIFRNPLAGPYVLGISSAASLFSAIGIMSAHILDLSSFYHLSISTFSALGAFLGLLIILLLLQTTSHNTVILLIGLMLSQLYSAAQSILSYFSNEHALKVFTLWTMGSIQNTNLFQAIMLLLVSLTFLLLLWRYTKFFMLYILGDEHAQVLGASVRLSKRILISTVGIVVGLITAYCGPIAFVGMTVPVIVRILTNRADVQKWMTHSFLHGGMFIILTDIVNQLFFRGALPLNILISIWGVPLMIWILIRQMKWLM